MATSLRSAEGEGIASTLAYVMEFVGDMDRAEQSETLAAAPAPPYRVVTQRIY